MIERNLESNAFKLEVRQHCSGNEEKYESINREERWCVHTIKIIVCFIQVQWYAGWKQTTELLISF